MKKLANEIESDTLELSHFDFCFAC